MEKRVQMATELAGRNKAARGEWSIRTEIWAFFVTGVSMNSRWRWWPILLARFAIVVAVAVIALCPQEDGAGIFSVACALHFIFMYSPCPCCRKTFALGKNSYMTIWHGYLGLECQHCGARILSRGPVK